MLRILLVSFLMIWIQNVNAKCRVSITKASESIAPQKICSGDLIFEDNFDKLDLSKWNHEQTLGGGGNDEFEWYTDDKRNSFTKDGILHIKPTLVADEFGENYLYSGTIDLKNHCTNSDNNGCRRTGSATNILNPVKSAKITTSESFSFKYGRVEVRAQTPSGDWLWPAIWMLPSEYKYGSSGPVSGEIDIMETKGNKHLVVGGNNDIGASLVGSTLHWGPTPETNQQERTYYEQRTSEGYNAAFHKYQVEWTADYIKFSVDDKEIGRAVPPSGGFWELGDLEKSGLPNPWSTGNKMAPFDEQFHLILNLAIGGNFFPDDGVNESGSKPWQNSSPNAMSQFWWGRKQWEPTWNLKSDQSHFKIDYVRIWAI